MSLLDQNRKNYFFERKEEWDFVSHADSKIYDEVKNKIGSLQAEGTFRKQVSLIDSRDELLLNVKKTPLLSLSKENYTILDSNNNFLGFVNGDLDDDTGVIMTDKNKNTILWAKGPYKEKKFGIGDKNNKIVAAFSFEDSKETIHRQYVSGIDKCNLEIRNFDLNRLLLLGFFVSIYSSFYDISPKGGEG